MSEARLTSAVLAGALMRLANHQGGFAAVIAKGDPTSGAIVVQMLEKGSFLGVYERMLDPSGRYLWSRSGPQDIENTKEISEYFLRRRSRDPDLWLIELDVPDAERFIAEILTEA
jgi:hypothetical protein